MKKNLKSNEMAKTLKRPLCGGSLWWAYEGIDFVVGLCGFVWFMW
jgi:hypothetical protein